MFHSRDGIIHVICSTVFSPDMSCAITAKKLDFVLVLP